MLRIRLQRKGRRNLPAYRIVVAEHSDPVKGKFIEILGHYLPIRDPKVFEFKEERIRHWVSVGAQPSQTVARLLKKYGMDGMDKFIVEKVFNKKPKNPPEEVVAEAPKPAEEAPKVEKPAEETPKEEKPVAEAPKVEKPVDEAPKEDKSAEEAPAA